MKNIIKLPVILVAIFMALMFTLNLSKFGYQVVVPGHSFISLGIFLLGIIIIFFGGYSFRKVNTTVNPMTPEQTTQLVTTGIYNYSRNPMYIGFLSWLIAWIIFLGNIVNLLFLPIFIFLVNRLYILPEEKALETIFKEEFTGYKKRVRRWI